MAYITGAGQTAPVKRETVSSLIEDFDPVLDRLGLLVERLETVHARIHGPTPSEVGKDNVPTPPQSMHASLNLRRSRLVGIAEHLERVVNGVEGGL